ncbi:MAG: zinc ribbon domain-containing protein [Desulfosarcina sp.]|nr:zinc ribbon domain-containing protein [Desulfosarcina sp.]MBC2743628.1 zinc ribbon domain-containing protein [Desulfosarcina sp.]MBC2766537.1 zinc ribbon domain-containing protein [Desulfosarcina sp.]
MPLYEYQCTKCGKIEEMIQKFSDAPLTTCRHCSGKLNKLISQSSFHLKGTGWYVTDYSKKSTSAANSRNSESTTSPGKKNSASGAESKAAKSDD